ncbi:MAG: hypothetical protein QOG66_3410 [Methylobacteriaceae bacterium]|nr:hypothetical protein [Methylobacteriaceae bacterium]
MNIKTALIGSFAAAAALVAVSADANARSWHYRSTSCGPSATIVKHHRYGFVGSDRDYGVRSRTSIRGERSAVRFGVRGGHDRFGVNVHERSGANVNINARGRGGEDRHGARFSGNERNTGAGAGGTTGRSASPSGMSNTGSSGGAASSGAGAKTGAGAGGGAGLGAGGGSSGGGMSSGAGGGGGGGGSR